MPGKVKVRIVAGRNLPVMDRASDTTDAYVEVKLGSVTHKTDVFRKSLNPSWNSEWFRFEVDDHDLQDEPLQIRLMDHDTYSANDAIGKVYVDLNPLLLPPPPPALGTTAVLGRHPQQQQPQQPQHQYCSSTASTPGTAPPLDPSIYMPSPVIPPPQPALASIAHHNTGPAVMSGWLPVYDTMHGLRGEVGVVVKVDLFSDFNRFRQSSCGVHFFFTPEIPATFTCQCVVGLVEELVINHDPEYEWIDKIRSPRASNEAKQTLFCKLSGMLQRKIGLKVLDMGGNAVLGYRQCFDLEGESGIVVRGLGTAVVLHHLSSLPPQQQQVVGASQLLQHHFKHQSPPSQQLLQNYQSPQLPTTEAATTAVKDQVGGKEVTLPCSGTKEVPARQGSNVLEENRNVPVVQNIDPTKNFSASEKCDWALDSTKASVGTKDNDAAILKGAAVNKHNCEISDFVVHGTNNKQENVCSESSETKLKDDDSDLNENNSIKYADQHLTVTESASIECNRPVDVRLDSNTTNDIDDTGAKRETKTKDVLNNTAVSEVIKNTVEEANQYPHNEDIASAGNCVNIWENFQYPEDDATTKKGLDEELRRAESEVKASFISTECGRKFTLATEDPDCISGPGTISSSVTDDSNAILVTDNELKETKKFSTTSTCPNLETQLPAFSTASGTTATQPETDGPSSATPTTMSNRRFSELDSNLGHQKGPPPPSARGSTVGSIISSAAVGGAGAFVRHPLISHESLSMLKYPFFTMTNFPHGFVLKIGGTVSARCVKLLERAHAPPVEVESRDSWWAQLRGEVRMHAKALGCNAVLGYTEFTTICDEVCILNVSGTAAIVCVSSSADTSGFASMSAALQQQQDDKPAYPQHHHCHPVHSYPGPIHNSSSFEKKDSEMTVQQGGSLRTRQTSVSEDGDGAGLSDGTPNRSAGYAGQPTAGTAAAPEPACCVCHSPFADAAELPFKVAITKCAVCKRGKVSDIVLATIEPPPGIPVTGRGVLIQARVFKQRKDLKGEQFAKEVSDALPFVEYEITRQIVNKVRIAGMNAVFGLRVRLSLGERLVVGVATGTAMYLTALPPPHPPQVASDGFENEHRRSHAQRVLTDTMYSNMECYGVVEPGWQRPTGYNPSVHFKDSDSEDEDDVTEDTDQGGNGDAATLGTIAATVGNTANSVEIDFSIGNKEACLLELDDSEDAEMAMLLLHCCSPAMQRLPLVTTQSVPGLLDHSTTAVQGVVPLTGVQMFTKVYRETFSSNAGLTQMTFNAYFDNVIQSICYRMRKLSPCVITGLRFDVEIPEEDELQITVLGAVVQLTTKLPEPGAVLLAKGGGGSQASSSRADTAAEDTANRKADAGDLIFKMEEEVSSTDDPTKAKSKQDCNFISGDPNNSAKHSAATSCSPPTTTQPGSTAQPTVPPSSSLAFPPAAAVVSTAPAGGSRSVRKLTYASSSSSSSGSISRPQLQHQARLQATPSLSSFPSVPSVPSFPSVPSNASLSSGSSATKQSFAKPSSREAVVQGTAATQYGTGRAWQGVYISPLPYVPGATVERHLGNLNFFFIRENTSVKESGGASVFVGGLVTEIIGIVRAHVAALGGTAIISYFMAECMLELNPHKNQGQCLINVGGDVVQTSCLPSPPPAAGAPSAAQPAADKAE